MQDSNGRPEASTGEGRGLVLKSTAYALKTASRVAGAVPTNAALASACVCPCGGGVAPVGPAPPRPAPPYPYGVGSGAVSISAGTASLPLSFPLPLPLPLPFPLGCSGMPFSASILMYSECFCMISGAFLMWGP